MNAGMKYEIKARAFELATGHLAPGKDAAAGTEISLSEREALWSRWRQEHGTCIDAMIQAFEETACVEV